MQLLDHHDAAWSASLHTLNAPRLYTVSPLHRAGIAPLFVEDGLPECIETGPLAPDTVVSVRATLMEDDRALAFLRDLPHWGRVPPLARSPGRLVRFPNPDDVEDPDILAVSWATLVQSAPAASRLAVQFLTPTTFRSQGKW